MGEFYTTSRKGRPGPTLHHDVADAPVNLSEVQMTDVGESTLSETTQGRRQAVHRTAQPSYQPNGVSAHCELRSILPGRGHRLRPVYLELNDHTLEVYRHQPGAVSCTRAESRLKLNNIVMGVTEPTICTLKVPEIRGVASSTYLVTIPLGSQPFFDKLAHAVRCAQAPSNASSITDWVASAETLQGRVSLTHPHRFRKWCAVDVTISRKGVAGAKFGWRPAGSSHPATLYLITGWNAMQLLSSDSAVRVRLFGYSNEDVGLTHVDLKLRTAASFQELAKFMREQLPHAVPKVFASAPERIVQGHDSRLCHLLSWRLLSQSNKWRWGWGVFVVDGANGQEGYLQVYKKLGDEPLQQKLGQYTLARLPVCKLQLIDGMPTNVTITAGCGADQLVLRFDSRTEQEEWWNALKRTQIRAAPLPTHAMQGHPLARHPATSRLFSYVWMLSKESPDSSLSEFLCPALLHGSGERATLLAIFELCYVFLEMTLQDGSIPSCTSVFRDASWRQFTQALVDFVLRFLDSSGKLERNATKQSVLLLVLYCDIRLETQSMTILDRSAVLVDLVAAMLHWVTQSSSQSTSQFLHKLLQYFSKYAVGGVGVLAEQRESHVQLEELLNKMQESTFTKKSVDLKQLRALCDPKCWDLHQVLNFYCPEDMDEALIRNANLEEYEQGAVKRFSDAVREQMSSNTCESLSTDIVLSFCPYIDRVERYERAIVWFPLERLELPRCKAHLFFQLIAMGAFEHSHAMEQIAQKVARGEFGDGAIEMIHFLVIFLVRDPIEQLPGELRVTPDDVRCRALRIWVMALLYEYDKQPRNELHKKIRGVLVDAFLSLCAGLWDQSSAKIKLLRGVAGDCAKQLETPTDAQNDNSVLRGISMSLSSIDNLQEYAGYNISAESMHHWLQRRLQGFLWLCLHINALDEFSHALTLPGTIPEARRSEYVDRLCSVLRSSDLGVGMQRWKCDRAWNDQLKELVGMEGFFTAYELFTHSSNLLSFSKLAQEVIQKLIKANPEVMKIYLSVVLRGQLPADPSPPTEAVGIHPRRGNSLRRELSASARDLRTKIVACTRTILDQIRHEKIMKRKEEAFKCFHELLDAIYAHDMQEEGFKRKLLPEIARFLQSDRESRQRQVDKIQTPAFTRRQTPATSQTTISLRSPPLASPRFQSLASARQLSLASARTNSLSSALFRSDSTISRHLLPEQGRLDSAMVAEFIKVHVRDEIEKHNRLIDRGEAETNIERIETLIICTLAMAVHDNWAGRKTNKAFSKEDENTTILKEVTPRTGGDPSHANLEMSVAGSGLPRVVRRFPDCPPNDRKERNIIFVDDNKIKTRIAGTDQEEEFANPEISTSLSAFAELVSDRGLRVFDLYLREGRNMRTRFFEVLFDGSLPANMVNAQHRVFPTANEVNHDDALLGAFRISKEFLWLFLSNDMRLLKCSVFWSEPILTMFGEDVAKKLDSLATSSEFRRVCSRSRGVQVDEAQLRQRVLRTYFLLLQLSVELLQSQQPDASSVFFGQQVQRVTATFLREAGAMAFISESRIGERTLLDLIVSRTTEARARNDGKRPAVDHPRAGIDDFEGFEAQDLATIAMSCIGVDHRIGAMANETSSEEERRRQTAASDALASLFQQFVMEDSPNEWVDRFKGVETLAYQLVYMFREQCEVAVEKFEAHIQCEMADRSHAERMQRPARERELLVDIFSTAKRRYAGGIVQQDMLRNPEWLNDHELLVDHVLSEASRSDNDEHIKLIRRITAEFMRERIRDKKMPLTPHHTQALAMLMASEFYAHRVDALSASLETNANVRKQKLEEHYHEFSTLILQMKTGEGKSVVIAFLAVFLYLTYNDCKQVHILTNNEALLQRDYEVFEKFCKRFTKANGYNRDVTCSPCIKKGTSICFTLKKGINNYFNENIFSGQSDLKGIILLVDEVDDLVVNEEPTQPYVKRDEQLSSGANDENPRLNFIEAFKELKKATINNKQPIRPQKVHQAVWQEAIGIKELAEKMIKQTPSTPRGNYKWDGTEYVMLDSEGRIPKVREQGDWISWMNYVWGRSDKMVKYSYFNVLCTPYLYRKYDCIIGLTGSVGGSKEREYIKKTYQAVCFEVPEFLNTCAGDGKIPPTHRGVRLKDTDEDQLDEVVKIVCDHYQKVPVLIITRGETELAKVHNKLTELAKEENGKLLSCTEGNGVARKVDSQIQRLQEHDPDELNYDGSVRTAQAKEWFKLTGKIIANAMEMHSVTIPEVSITDQQRQGQSPNLIPDRVLVIEYCPANNDPSSVTDFFATQMEVDKELVLVQLRGDILTVSVCCNEDKEDEQYGKLESAMQNAESCLRLSKEMAGSPPIARKPWNPVKELTYFQITVTDKWGGRGHDYESKHDRAEQAGGPLVIATSVPDAREWTQWKGRTARQDKKGQYIVVLSRESEKRAAREEGRERYADTLLNEVATCAQLGDKLERESKDLEPTSNPAKFKSLEAIKHYEEATSKLIEAVDGNVHARLQHYQSSQMRGVWMNQLCELYFEKYPRDLQATWPATSNAARNGADDVKLSRLIRDMIYFKSGTDILNQVTSKFGEDVANALQRLPKPWAIEESTEFGACVTARPPPNRIIFTIDVSGSMSETCTRNTNGAAISRLNVVHESLNVILREIISEEDEVLLIEFANCVHERSRGFLAYQNIETHVNEMVNEFELGVKSYRRSPGSEQAKIFIERHGRTRLYAALAKAASRCTTYKSPVWILALTDGANNDPDDQGTQGQRHTFNVAKRALEEARNKNPEVNLAVICFFGNEIQPDIKDRIRDDLNELIELTRKGLLKEATNALQLRNAFQDIAHAAAPVAGAS